MYEDMTRSITARIASVIGITMVNAATPMIGTMIRSISSVPYAEEEIMSGARTPMATGVASRSCVSCSDTRGRPRIRFLSLYPSDSGTVGPPPDGWRSGASCRDRGSIGSSGPSTARSMFHGGGAGRFSRG
jgi:hypothetical protein